MNITALEEYGLRCLLRVAENAPGEAISAQAIADKEGLSISYAQKMLRVLSKAGLVESRRGVQGGFYLAAPPEEITVGDAIRALGGIFQVEDICDRHTGELEACAHRCNCTIRPVWAHISKFVVQTLDAISLADLLNDESQIVQHLEKSLPHREHGVSPG